MLQRRLLSLWYPKTLLKRGGAPGDLTALALWCQIYSPLTATDPPDGIMIDITGCAHLFRGEAGLAASLAARLPGVRLAIANTAAAAWALARYGEPGSEDILDLPLAALQIDARVVTKLRRIGVRRIGELQRLPRAEIVARYGQDPVLRLAQALGGAPEALRFIAPPPEWREIEPYAEPIFAPMQLQGALQRLTIKLCNSLRAAMRGATAIVARFYRIDRQCPQIILGFAAPCADEPQISKLLCEKLAQHIDPGFGIEAISLEANTTEPLVPVQRGMAEETPDYTQALNTLLNRLGAKRLWRIGSFASYIPEYAAKRLPVNAVPASYAKPPHPRPLRLLARPDAITAIAPVPDDPPVLFTWRGKVHKIIQATGPERIARDWWCHEHDNTRPESEKIRDYYVVEDDEGARFWLFRAGLHEGVSPARWYLHGFFA